MLGVETLAAGGAAGDGSLGAVAVGEGVVNGAGVAAGAGDGGSGGFITLILKAPCVTRRKGWDSFGRAPLLFHYGCNIGWRVLERKILFSIN